MANEEHNNGAGSAQAGPVPDTELENQQEMNLSRNMRANDWNGIWQALAGNMVGPFVGILAIRLGATNAQIGLLSSLPAAASIMATIPGARLVDRSADKKRVTTLFFFLTRIFFLIFAAVPFLPPTWRTTALVAAVALSNLPGAVANTAYQSLIADVIPANRRASAYSSRNRLMSVLGNVTLLGTGLLLDRLIFPGGYQIMFAIAFALAVAELYALTQFIMPTRAAAAAATQRGDGGIGSGAAAVGGTVVPVRIANPPLLRLRQAVQGIRSQRAFVSFAMTSMIFHFGWQMCGPLFTKYMVSYLGANNLWISIISIAGSISAFFSFPIWARWADRYGNRKLVGYAACGMALSPLIYAISRDLLTLTILNTVINFFVAGIIMLLFNGLLEVVPAEGRTSYLAYYNTLVNVMAMITPLIGVAIMSRVSIYAAFYTAGAIRFLGGLALIAVVGPLRKGETTA